MTLCRHCKNIHTQERFFTECSGVKACSIGRRAFARLRPEAAREIGRVGKAQAVSDLGHGQAGEGQQAAGLGHGQRLDMAGRAGAKRRLAEAVQVAGRAAARKKKEDNHALTSE